MWGCDRVFYYPDARVRGTPDEYDLAYQDVFFTTSDGVRLHGWYFPADMTIGNRAAKPLGTVLHLHGNAANITGHYEFVRWLPDAGYNLLAFDYRGYGRSGGTITRAGSILDAEAALAYLREHSDVDPDRIFVIGQSLGGAVATVMAARQKGKIQALVIDGAFARYRDIARHHVMHQPLTCAVGWWYPFLLDRQCDPIDHVAEISPTPMLFIHGERDRVVPARMGRELYEKAKEPKELWIVPGMDHYEVWEDRAEELHGRILEFFKRAAERTSRT